jgi:hypothetical protein
MQLVKSITPKKINTLRGLQATLLVFVLTAFSPVFSQDNSPYSRYGVGDLVPPTSIIGRSMGGLSAGYSDYLSINFNNPASYSGFQGNKELKSKKLGSGRAILDIGINFEGRKLTEPATSKTFTANNALFSYVQVGVPLKQNWGLSFGLRPISRISYKMFRSERLVNPIAPFNTIDSALTRFEGDGGSYMASIGTGFSVYKKVHEGKNRMEENLSVGINGGYLFGKKNYSTRRSFINDTVEYAQANYQTQTNFGNLNFNAGIQYKLPLNKKILLTVGAYGSWGQKLNATQDILRETFQYNAALGEIRLDSVSDQKDIKGTIELPASFTFGFVLQKYPVAYKEGGWLFGIDFSQQGWDNYRFYGQKDSVKNKWEVRAGVQLNPKLNRNYFSQVAYRFGLFMGPDYINVGNKLSQFGASFGLGLPMAISRQAPNQISIINAGFEYIKRGNNDNLLKENMFRVSLGLSLSDIWFIKRKYE